MHDVKKNDSQSKIKSLPIMLFAGTMGLGGLCSAYKKLSEIFDLPNEIFSALRALDCTVFCLLSAFYLFKLLKFKEEVKAEFSHPINRRIYHLAFSFSSSLQRRAATILLAFLRGFRLANDFYALRNFFLDRRKIRYRDAKSGMVYPRSGQLANPDHSQKISSDLVLF